mgnify:FL=1
MTFFSKAYYLFSKSILPFWKEVGKKNISAVIKSPLKHYFNAVKTPFKRCYNRMKSLDE